jgi:DNA-binding NarL/FixJ family response regulator
MPAADRVTILLADDDALRREGLAAVLESAANFLVAARCQDGEQALAGIREQNPRVAVVDINVPRLHGIELVRRVRAENLGTKVILVSGTADDEIVREAVRAGADGYLLKNGPARHLVDAINYVCDGGQYFSPQLGRDGRDRHLLEEPPRTPSPPPPAVAPIPADPLELKPGEPEEDYERARRRGAAPLRERLRQETGDLDERDHRIMSMMADGLKPILDRLEEIDDRVTQMEDGDAMVPEDPRGWLSTQLADTFRGERGGMRAPARTSRDIEAHLPQMIEQAVAERFENMAGKLQREIEETHVKTLETFVKNVQVKLVQRVSSLEQDMARHTQAMRQLRDSSQRTEENLSRLISGVDKLAQDLPRRIAQATTQAAQTTTDSSDGGAVARETTQAATGQNKDGVRRRRSTVKGPLLVWAGVFVVAGLWLAIYFDLHSRGTEPATSAPAAAAAKDAPPAQGRAPQLPAGADNKTKMKVAQEFTDRKDYTKAEQLYREVVQAEPDNADALRALASVLYREDKLAESAAILDKIK